MTVITRTEPEDSARLRKSLEREQGPTDEQRDQTLGFGSRTLGYGEPEDPTRVSFPFLRRIMRDHGVAMGLHYTESPILRASWYIAADDAKAAAFADNLIRPIYGSTAAAILRFLWAGYSPAVKNMMSVNPEWKYMVDGEVKQVWDSTAVDARVYKPLKILAPEACRLTYDRSGRWNGIQWDEHYVGAGGFVLGGQQKPSIDLAHSFWATLGSETVDGDPYGFARCAYCAPIFHMYRYIWTLLAHAFENSADPGPEVYFPKDDNVAEGGLTNREVALLIARRKRSGSSIAIPSDVYEDYQSRTTNIPKWKIHYSEVKTNFVALQDFLGYLETLKFRALLISEMSLGEGQQGSSSRNVAGTMVSQRDAAQAALMDLVVKVIMDQLVAPAMAINMPWYQGRLEMRTIGFGKEDDDIVRQIFQLAGQKDLSEFGIDLNRLADSKGFPMLDLQEQQRQRELSIQQANNTQTPAVEPTQGRRAFVTQTGFGEMVYHQLHDPIDLSSKADGDFVASLPRTVTWEDRAVVDAARELRSHLAELTKHPEDRLALTVDVQRCLYRAYDLALAEATRRLNIEPATRDSVDTDLLDRRARELVAEVFDNEMLLTPEWLSQVGVLDARNRAVVGACNLADVPVQVLEHGPLRGSIVAPQESLYDGGHAREIRPLPKAPKDLEIRRQRLDGEHLARYDEDAGVVLLSDGINPQQEADFMIALGDRLAA